MHGYTAGMRQRTDLSCASRAVRDLDEDERGHDTSSCGRCEEVVCRRGRDRVGSDGHCGAIASPYGASDAVCRRSNTPRSASRSLRGASRSLRWASKQVRWLCETIRSACKVARWRSRPVCSSSGALRSRREAARWTERIDLLGAHGVVLAAQSALHALQSGLRRVRSASYALRNGLLARGNALLARRGDQHAPHGVLQRMQGARHPQRRGARRTEHLHVGTAVTNKRAEIAIAGKVLEPAGAIDVDQMAIDERGAVTTKRSELNAARDDADRASTDHGDEVVGDQLLQRRQHRSAGEEGLRRTYTAPGTPVATWPMQ